MNKMVFFDFDGVLTLVGHACLEACRKLADQHDLPYVQFSETFHKYAEQLLYRPARYESIIDDLNSDMQSNITVQDILDAAATAKPNTAMLALAEELRSQGIGTGIITDNNLERMEVLYNKYEFSKFKPIVVSAKLGFGKATHEEIFLEAMREAGVVPSESMFIDNSKRNLPLAVSAGMHTYFHDEELNDVPAFRAELKRLAFLR